MDEYVIEVENLTKIFYPKRRFFEFIKNPFRKTLGLKALNRVNLKVKKNEIFCLVGPNGAGKTTLIKILAGLILADSGEAKILGLDVIKDELKVKASIGLLTGEERSFYWRLTGRENLEFFGYLYNLSKSQIKKRIEELVLLLEIEEYLDRRFQEYSTGIKQRFSIARALLNDPKIIFMDEPTKNLDPLVAESIRRFIKEELKNKQNKTIFFATHNLEEAFDLGETIAIMDRGKIKVMDSPEGLKRNSGFKEPQDIFKYYVVS